MVSFYGFLDSWTCFSKFSSLIWSWSLISHWVRFKRVQRHWVVDDQYFLDDFKVKRPVRVSNYQMMTTACEKKFGDGLGDKDSLPSVRCLDKGAEHFTKIPWPESACIPVDTTVTGTWNSVDLNLKYNVIDYYEHVYLRHRMQINVSLIVSLLVYFWVMKSTFWFGGAGYQRQVGHYVEDLLLFFFHFRRYFSSIPG